MSQENNTQEILPEPKPLFPTFDSLQDVVDFAYSSLPIISQNELFSILMIHQNTLLKVQQCQSNQSTK